MVIRTPDAWKLARAVAGMDLNGELDAMAEPWRSMAMHLNLLTPLDRQGAFGAMLAARSDRDELVMALANQRPDEPPPEDDGEPEDEWEPVRMGTLPPVEPFPLDVLPCPARDLATAAAESIGCPIDFAAVAILAAASGLIGRSASLLVKPGYFESASLYLALVGSPSCGKSPALSAALAPVWSIADRLYQDGRAQINAWNETDSKGRGEKPILRRIVTTDPTTEALGPILAQNPRGLIVAPDEMTKWVMSMDQYKGGKGGDRPFYLSAWKGEPVYVDRAKNMSEPIVVPHPFLTVAGGLTPGMLTELPEGRGRDDGFMARLLFAYPDPKRPCYSASGIPDAVANEWDRMAASLWGRAMRERDGKSIPHVFKWSTAAAAAWAEWCNAHRAEQDADDFLDSLEGPWGKLEAYAARMALLLFLMNLASDPTRSRDGQGEQPELPRTILDDAASLVRYFKSHARRVYAVIDKKLIDGGENVRALTRWILRGDLADFSTRDIGRNFDRFRDDPAALNDALGWMASHNLIRPRPDSEAPNPGKPGRKRAPTYDVNPHLRTGPRFRRFRQNPRS